MINEKAWEKKKKGVYVSFMNLGKVYDRVNREAVCQVLRIYDMSGKLLNSIESTYIIISLSCVRVKSGDRE